MWGPRRGEGRGPQPRAHRPKGADRRAYSQSKFPTLKMESGPVRLVQRDRTRAEASASGVRQSARGVRVPPAEQGAGPAAVANGSTEAARAPGRHEFHDRRRTPERRACSRGRRNPCPLRGPSTEDAEQGGPPRASSNWFCRWASEACPGRAIAVGGPPGAAPSASVRPPGWTIPCPLHVRCHHLRAPSDLPGAMVTPVPAAASSQPLLRATSDSRRAPCAWRCVLSWATRGSFLTPHSLPGCNATGDRIPSVPQLQGGSRETCDDE